LGIVVLKHLEIAPIQILFLHQSISECFHCYQIRNVMYIAYLHSPKPKILKQQISPPKWRCYLVQICSELIDWCLLDPSEGGYLCFHCISIHFSYLNYLKVRHNATNRRIARYFDCEGPKIEKSYKFGDINTATSLIWHRNWFFKVRFCHNNFEKPQFGQITKVQFTKIED